MIVSDVLSIAFNISFIISFVLLLITLITVKFESVHKVVKDGLFLSIIIFVIFSFLIFAAKMIELFFEFKYY